MNEIFREAFAEGDVQKVAALIADGADIRYCDENGYDALINAAYASDALTDDQLSALLTLLIENGVSVTGRSSYGESALRRLSSAGRFAAVRQLLDAGADPAELELTPLIEAVMFGTLADVETALTQDAGLDETDGCERTAWLVAVQMGDIAKAKLLLERGARSDIRGEYGAPPLFYAIENHRNAMLTWLLELGADIHQTDGMDRTALMAAVECGNGDAVEVLLSLGADADQKTKFGSVLSFASAREVAAHLLDAGADPQELSSEGRRAILGLSQEADRELLTVSVEEFQKYRLRRFGEQNPERMNNPFWEGMIRCGLNAFQAETRVMGKRDYSAREGPVWCADRFGQSLTFLPDGRIVQVAGEHEDHYDPDFCIYNDVFVHDPDGNITIYGYPETVFPPTDFHTATLIGRYIYLIGSLGYMGTRLYGKTPVYRLDTETFRIETLETTGRNPGWIYKHRAVFLSPNTIQITGGKVVTQGSGREEHSANTDTFILDVETLVWS